MTLPTRSKYPAAPTRSQPGLVCMPVPAKAPLRVLAMKRHVLGPVVWLLIGVALLLGPARPRFSLLGWFPFVRTALDAVGQLLAYAAMGGLAWAAEPQTCGRDGPPLHP